jgi:hypothetical protein
MPQDVQQQATESRIDRVELAIALVLQFGIFIVTAGAL